MFYGLQKKFSESAICFFLFIATIVLNVLKTNED